MALQADGRILVGGHFQTIDGLARPGFARLRADGSVDPGFAPAVGGTVQAIAVQADGGILIGGQFLEIDGQPRSRIARLRADGSLDPAFATAVDGMVQALALLGDGRLLIAGTFGQVGDLPAPGFARLAGAQAALSRLDFQSGELRWLRAGAAPELVQAPVLQVEHAGVAVEQLPMTRIAGGWTRTGIGAAAPGTLLGLRVRGVATVASSVGGSGPDRGAAAAAGRERGAAGIREWLRVVAPDNRARRVSRSLTSAWRCTCPATPRPRSERRRCAR
ncbi:MAG: delta-60 repeat domain-containing protein [Rhodanobacteraceae bacterium]|nr:delta-60 repeat domain-containing protein [Rhodanobacteraceae bacterium]